MAHNLLIILHAAAGILCFAAGVLSLRVTSVRSWPFLTYAACLLALVMFLAAVVAVDWSGLDGISRWVYLGLIVLSMYMLWRAAHGGTMLHRQHGPWRRRYLDDIGFTLISLFDGFVIVAAIDLAAPGWLVAVIAAGGVAAGIASIDRVKAHLVVS